MIRIARSSVLAVLTAAALTATLGLPDVVTAAPNPRKVRVCALRPLPLPADLNGYARVVDPTGRFTAGVGYRVTDDDRHPLLLLWDGLARRDGPPRRPLVWDEPRLTIVPTEAELQLASINRHGVIIGSGFVDNSHRPWRYRNGQLEWLPIPPTVSGASAQGINSRGDIVGSGAVEETETSLPLLWPADRPGAVEVIDAPPNAGATEILDDGTIVGSAGGSGGSLSSGWVRRPDGTTVLLTAPAARWSTVFAAQGDWAVGRIGAGSPYEDSTSVRWNLRTGLAVAVNPALGPASDVNARGTVLGDRAVDHDGRIVPLRGAIPDVLIIFGWAIADDGTVVGSTNGTRLRPARWIGC
ncbi:hypothetical protein [Micromonospora sp. NPDC000668]|uniref:hypothetical protein n=1 Tax=Micromonospora sp. NPDC000668 TaxID=3364219 RepID=UPI0036AAE427